MTASLPCFVGLMIRQDYKFSGTLNEVVVKGFPVDKSEK